MTIKSINSTNIVRVKKDRNYTTINNTCLRDDRLSWKAKGIMAYFLQLPDDWVINLEEIITHSPEGEKAFRSGLNELKEHGYVVRSQVRDDKKRIVGWETIIYEVPKTLDNTLLAQKLHVGFLHVEKQDVENAGLLSTNITNDLKELNTNNIKHTQQAAEIESQFEQFWSFYPKKVDKKKAFDKFKLKLKKHDFDTILKGTASYAKVMQLNNTDKQYIKGAAVFLNNENYLDDQSELLTNKSSKQNKNTLFNPWEVQDARESNQTNLFDNSGSIPTTVKQIGFGDVL